jgi:hypothetical protein
MKKIFLLLTVLGLAAAPLSAQQELVRLTRYEGERITGVSASSAFDVYLIRSDQTRVVAEIDSRFEDRLALSLDANGIVRVGLRSDLGSLRGLIGRNTVMKLTVYLPELTLLKASGASDVHTEGDFTAGRCEIELSGASELDQLNLRCDFLKLSLSGSSDAELNAAAGEIQAIVAGASELDATLTATGLTLTCAGASDADLQGEVDRARLIASGASDLNAMSLAVGRLNVTAISASEVSVWVTEELRAEAKAASSIRYRGDPATFSTRSNSASRIRKVP